jgi:hypothetical protein
MEKGPENGKESPHSAHAKLMNEWWAQTLFIFWNDEDKLWTNGARHVKYGTQTASLYM